MPLHNQHSLKQMNKPFKVKSDICELRFPDITVEEASKIDYESYKSNEHNSFLEMKALFSSIDFEIYYKNTKIYDSKDSDIEEQDFDFCVQVYNTIKSELYLNKEEFAKFSKECVDFLNNSDSKSKMPYELLLAHNILNNNATLTVSEIEKMNIKKYEKIITAISILQKHLQLKQQ